MSAIHACKSYFINDETWELMPQTHLDLLGKEVLVYIPSPVWTFGKETEHIVSRWFRGHGTMPKRVKLICKYCNDIKLNGFNIQMNFSYKDVVIKLHERDVTLELKAEPRMGRFKYQNTNAVGTTTVWYELYVNGKRYDHKSEFHEIKWSWPFFRPVTGFADWGTNSSGLIGDNLFVFGIDHREWDIYFRGTKLSGQCYCAVFGPWAILLGDKFEFDSLVYLNGVREGVLDVDYIAFSVNPYVTKAAMLVR